MGTKPVTSGPVYNITLEVAQQADLPMSRVYIIKNVQATVFATGRNP